MRPIQVGTKRRAVVILTVLIATVPALGQDANSFSFQADDAGPRFEVTAEGLSAIYVGGRQVAKGAWRAADASGLVATDADDANRWTWEFPRKRIERVGERHARVYHVGPEVAVTYDFLFDGEDVEVRCLIANGSAERTSLCVDIAGPVFTFDRTPAGLSFRYDASAFQRLGALRWHPSYHNNFGGSYLADGSYGVGATPLRNGLLPTALWWPENRRDPNHRPVHYVRALAIPPGSSVRLDFALRVSPSRDWKHLLEPYRRHFARTYGPVRYRADNRPIGCVQGANGRAADPNTNPYGWQWLPHRFDTPEGVEAFTKHTVAVLQRAGAQGVIVWAHTGWNPRGANFRPDFDVLPPEMDALMGKLAKPFLDANLRLGVCARPQIVTTATWTTDAVLNLRPDEPTQMAMVERRFDRLIRKGVTLYYIDTFGNNAFDAETLRRLRHRWGPSQVQAYTEFWSDVSLLYAGGYTQYRWNPDANSYYEFWHREHLWEVCQWLAPGVQLTSPAWLPDPKNPLPEGTPDAFHYLYARHVIPMFYTGTRTTGDMADEARKLSAEYLNDQGRWRK